MPLGALARRTLVATPPAGLAARAPPAEPQRPVLQLLARDASLVCCLARPAAADTPTRPRSSPPVDPVRPPPRRPPEVPVRLRERVLVPVRDHVPPHRHCRDAETFPDADRVELDPTPHFVLLSAHSDNVTVTSVRSVRSRPARRGRAARRGRGSAARTSRRRRASRTLSCRRCRCPTRTGRARWHAGHASPLLLLVRAAAPRPASACRLLDHADRHPAQHELREPEQPLRPVLRDPAHRRPVTVPQHVDLLEHVPPGRSSRGRPQRHPERCVLGADRYLERHGQHRLAAHAFTDLRGLARRRARSSRTSNHRTPPNRPAQDTFSRTFASIVTAGPPPPTPCPGR